MVEEQDTAVTEVATPAPVVTQSKDCLVVVHPLDRAAGRRYRLDQTPLRIGRDDDNEIVLEEGEVSRRHARLERRGQSLVIMDVGSRNGTLLNDHELSGVVELHTGDRIKIGATIFKYLSGGDLEAAFHEQIFRNSITDELTELPNRRHFTDELARECARTRRHKRPLSLLVLDIDRFKAVNDAYGHVFGDLVLRRSAAALRRGLRQNDEIARVGGEEFAVLLPETDLDEAVEVAQRLSHAVAQEVVRFRETEVRVTISIGCAQFREGDADPEHFYQRADERLYLAKEAGRNRIVAVGRRRP